MAKRVKKLAAPRDAVAQIDGLLGGRAPAAVAAPVAMRHFTPDEHIAWCEANLYRDTKGFGWQPLKYGGWQRSAIRKLFAVDAAGLLEHKTVMPCFPRRCGKSEVTGAYDIHRAIEYADQKIVIQANSQDQGEGTVFGEICKMIENSPLMAERVRAGEIVVGTEAVLFPRTGSAISVQPFAERSTYGQKIHVYHNTELCRAPSDSVFQVGASSTGDAWCGLSIVDSNVGDASNAVWRMVQSAEAAEEEIAKAAAEGRAPDPTIGDPTIGCVYIAFADLDDCLMRGCGVGLAAGEEPIHPWLDPAWIRSRFVNMTRAEFLRNHCNQPTGAGETLWTEEQIAPLFVAWPAILTPERIEKAVAEYSGRMAVGVGMDRAGAFSQDPDRSAVGAVGKIIVPALIGARLPVYDAKGAVVGDEVIDGSMYILLGLWEFMYALRDPIQAKVAQIDRTWGIGRAKLEAYQASDLVEWTKTQRFGDRCEIVHMTSQAKLQLVQFAGGLVMTRRFRASSHYAILRAEFLNYREDASTGTPSFGGPKVYKDLDFPDDAGGTVRRRVRIKDDELETVLWAIAAARDATAAGKCVVIDKPRGL